MRARKRFAAMALSSVLLAGCGDTGCFGWFDWGWGWDSGGDTSTSTTTSSSTTSTTLAPPPPPTTTACHDIDDENGLVAKFEVVGGSYVYEKPPGNEYVITLSNTSSTGGTWTSTVPIGAVVVKGGNGQYATPVNGATSGTFSNSGLLSEGGQVPAISNLQFYCTDPDGGGGTTTTTAQATSTTIASTSTTAATSTTTSGDGSNDGCNWGSDWNWNWGYSIDWGF